MVVLLATDIAAVKRKELVTACETLAFET